MIKTPQDQLTSVDWNNVRVAKEKAIPLMIAEEKEGRSTIYNRESLIHVRQKLGEGTVGAEIGVWCGDLSVLMLDWFKPTKLYLVDPWKLYPDFEHELDMAKFDRVTQSQYFKQDEFDRMHKYTVDRFVGNNIVDIRRGMSEDVVKEIPDSSIDWVYIDGSHTEKYVYRDLVGWWPKIKIGGVLCGHDFLFDGIPPALKQFSSETGVEVWPYGSDWWIDK